MGISWALRFVWLFTWIFYLKILFVCMHRNENRKKKYIFIMFVSFFFSFKSIDFLETFLKRASLTRSHNLRKSLFFDVNFFSSLSHKKNLYIYSYIICNLYWSAVVKANIKWNHWYRYQATGDIIYMDHVRAEKNIK